MDVAISFGHRKVADDTGYDGRHDARRNLVLLPEIAHALSNFDQFGLDAFRQQIRRAARFAKQILLWQV